MNSPIVFISYSHLDTECKDRLVLHLKALEKNGAILNEWDDKKIETSDDWEKEIRDSMNAASVAVLMISPGFLASDFIMDVEVPIFLERKQKEGLRIFPIIIKNCIWKEIGWLKSIQAYTANGEPLLKCDENEIDDHLVKFVSEIKHAIGVGTRTTEDRKYLPLSPDKISLAKMPETNPDVFGRDKQFVELDEAWESNDTKIVTIVASGGTGKTALVNEWLNRMELKDYDGADKVLGWSFYSQGADVGRQVSAEPFIAFALEWFGDPETANSEASAFVKAEKLANLVREQKTLLVLDGLEPLQDPANCRINDRAISYFLKELAHHNPGLCIITTRLDVDDLRDDIHSSVKVIELDRLSVEAGSNLLKNLGVKGMFDELDKAVDDLKGHALGLTLLGQYVVDVYDGDIRKRDLIPKLMDDDEYGEHAKKVMDAYEIWFEGKPEQDIIRIMGLFDRPAPMGAIDALRSGTPIKELTTKINGLTDRDWKLALKRLKTARLIEEKTGNDGKRELDCHPLIREHFGKKLETKNPKAWKEAHSRLYEWYKSTAKHYPDTIEEMAPLYSAVSHGCQAGRYQEAEAEVYYQRIKRGQEHYSTRKLGAFGSDLSALSGFFKITWSKTVEGLSESSKAFVLNQAGFYLRALSRLKEATEPIKTALENTEAQEDWKNAAIDASNLSELYLTIGDVSEAVEYGKQSVELADKSGDAGQRMINRATYADALHQVARLDEAESLFIEAEGMQKEFQPEYPLLYSQRGYKYCDLLLEQGKYEDVLRRAEQTLEWLEQANLDILSIALDNLSLGRAYMLRKDADFTKAYEQLDQAVNGLRQSGHQDEIPRGLLTRAEMWRLRKDFEKARKDLDEAFAIAERGEMGLHLADCHLEYARLYVAMGDKDKAKEHRDTAKKMIDDMGYHRRDKEVEALDVELGRKPTP